MLLEILRVTLHVQVYHLIGLTLMKAVVFQHFPAQIQAQLNSSGCSP